MRSPSASGLALLVSISITGDIVYADHIRLPATGTLRTALPKEGYLSFQKGTNGEERTGWTDVRHPSLVGQDRRLNDPLRGFDRSDHFVQVRSHLVQDDALSLPSPVSQRRIADDFDFANRVWVQAGLAVLEASHDTVRVNGVTFPIDPGLLTFGELGTIFDAVSSRRPFVDAWYIQSFEEEGQTGETNWPGSFSIRNPGFAVTDGRNATTFSHELGHFLLDTADHEADPLNIMASGDARFFPGRTTDPESPLPWNVAATLDVVGMPMSTNANGSPRVGGVEQVTALQAIDATGGTAVGNPDIHNPYVSFSDEHFAAGDIADFDWVEDAVNLERLFTPGDNHQIDRPPFEDYLLWEIGAIAFPPEPGPAADNGGHDHGNWGQLALGPFRGPSFRFVDVISQIGRYVDSDIGADGARSRRESALDYDLWFSADAMDWVQVLQPETVFERGWTDASMAEDYIARWVAPFDARFVRIKAHVGGLHDSNTQIDAVIASAAPEPSTLVLLFFGALCLYRHWRHMGARC
jgi:hypothetical protein